MMTALNSHEKIKAVLLATALGVLLCFFLPFTHFLYVEGVSPYFGKVTSLKFSLFPILAIGLYFTLNPSWKWSSKGLSFLLYSTPFPVMLAFLYGRLTSIFEGELLEASTYYWYVVCIPIGEEFLFRGWVFEIFERRFPEKILLRTVPFSVTLWITSLLFSLWHFQNLGRNPFGLVLIQVVYTFFTGFWLGQIRLRAGNPIPSCIAHSLLNLASLCFY